MISRDTWIPVGLVALLFILAGGLVLAGHHGRLTDRTSDHDHTAELTARFAAIHDAAASRPLSLAAARSIAHGTGISGRIESAAFWVLFELGESETAARAVLENGHFDRGTLEIRGIDQMADLVFGTKAERLSDGELGLFCYWSAHGQDSWGPDDILEARQHVIDRMFERAAITAEARDSLTSKSLALRPTPIPID